MDNLWDLFKRRVPAVTERDLLFTDWTFMHKPKRRLVTGLERKCKLRMKCLHMDLPAVKFRFVIASGSGQA